MENSSNIPPTPYRFSNEELRALQECNSESFFYRSLPFSAIMGLATHIGVKNGYIGTTRYGSAPKVAMAVIAGYILGKVSYQGKCAEKIMALPDSKLGAALRERRRGGKYQESISMDQQDISTIFGDSKPSDVYSDVRGRESAPSYMDIDTDRRQEDIENSSWNRHEDTRMEIDSLLPPPPSKTVTSYDELRRRNREEYEASRSRYTRPPVRQEDVAAPPPIESRPVDPLLQNDYKRPKSTNIYGDDWDK